MTTAAEWIEELARFGMRPGLDRINALLDRLGRPEEGIPAVHIAGTNGKGSTARLIAAALEGAGLRVGLTVSPDLGDRRERILVNGALARSTAWESLASRVRAAAAGIADPPTQFEALTAMAFLAFRDAAVDVMVVEVGLGGRHDATNVLRQPLVTVVTPVALDHQEVLGKRLEDIAADKAGVVKPGVPVVAAPQAPPVRAVLMAACRAVDAPLVWARGRILESGPAGVRIRVGADEVASGLLGRHQGTNLAVAWEAVLSVRRSWGEPLDLGRLKTGLAAARWPGRLEWVDGMPPLLVDGAHNLHGANALGRALQEDHLRKRWHLVFGCYVDKPGEAMLNVLVPHVASLVLARPAGPRGRDPESLSPAIPAGVPWVVEEDPRTALLRAEEQAGAVGAVLAAGSLAVVGAIRAARLGPAVPQEWPDVWPRRA